MKTGGTATTADTYRLHVPGQGWMPLVVLVSGAPGSGKTTLACQLAGALELPHLMRDEMWSGLRFTEERGGPPSLRSRGIAAEYGAMEHLLAVGVSLVADGTLYRGEFESHIRRLGDLAEVVNVHCRAADASERYRQRQGERCLAPDLVSRQLDRLATTVHLVTEPLDLGCRLIEVQTDDGYDPPIATIVSELAHPPLP